MASTRRETLVLLAGDLLFLVFSLWFALALRNLALPSLGYFRHNFVPFLPIFLLSGVIFYIAGLYEKQTRLVKRVMGVRILGAQTANAALAAIIFFLLPLSIAPKTILFLYLAISVASVSAWRFYLLPFFSISDPALALIVGKGKDVEELVEEVNGNSRYAIRFSERIEPGEESDHVLSGRITSAVQRGVSAIVLDVSDARVNAELPALYDAMLSGATFIEFAALYEDIFDRIPLAHIDYAWLLGNLPAQRSIYDFFKRAFDILLASIGLVIASIFILPAAAVLQLTGGMPFIFPERIGRGGSVIRLAKLRTMLFYDAGDPEKQRLNRVTGFGRFLRKTRIDELPQLWNILTGDLSFIGPRPELPAIAETYEQEIPFYSVRHLIAPGLSGWAQIRDYDAPRGPADVGRTRRKLSYDLYYVRHRSFGLDLAIALKTVRALAAFSGT